MQTIDVQNAIQVIIRISHTAEAGQHGYGMRMAVRKLRELLHLNPPHAPASPESGAGAWCPQCGPQQMIDGDGCCRMCGSTAVGAGATQALALLDCVRPESGAGGEVKPSVDSPLPWHIKPDVLQVVYDAKDEIVCDCPYSTDAAFIVAVANARTSRKTPIDYNGRGGFYCRENTSCLLEDGHTGPCSTVDNATNRAEEKNDD